MAESLSWEEVHEFVRRLTYKPGYNLLVQPGALFDDRGTPIYDEYVLTVQFIAPSSRASPSDSVPIGPIAWSNSINAYARTNVGALRNFVFQCIMGLERHEAMEWFAQDGICVDDPHQGNTPVQVQQGLPPAWGGSNYVMVPKPDDSYFVADL